jgi:DNA-binding CsgD family transcriptional regulator
MLASYEGRLAEAERLAQESLALGQQAQGQNLIAAFGGQLLVIRWQQGRMDELMPLVTSSINQQPHITTWRAVQAFIHCETDRMAEARAAVDSIYAMGSPELPPDNTRLIDVVVLALVTAALDRSGAVDALYEDLLPYERRNIVLAEGVICVGAADYYLGLLAATARRWQDAEQHFEVAIEMNERGRAWPWLALAQYGYARMLRSRHGPGDRAKARELLGRAGPAARDLGMAVLSARVERLQAARDDTAHSNGLTRRETEVLRLVAGGLSNREISEKLSISERTTARHITNVYGKIGARNRSDATAYAIRSGLVQD